MSNSHYSMDDELDRMWKAQIDNVQTAASRFSLF